MMANSVNFSLFKEEDSGEMSKLLGKVFAQGDPPAVALGLTASEFEEFVRLFCPKAGAERLSIVARSAETGEMCGALLAEDSASELPEDLDQTSPKFDPVIDILGQLDAEYWANRTKQPRESVHLFLLGVAPPFAGQGIAQQLVGECMANAENRAYRMAVTEATNRISQHVFRKLGFVERVKKSYRDHLFEGTAYFHSIVDQGGPMLMDRTLSDPGIYLT